MSGTLETLAEIARLGRYAESRRHDFTRSEPCVWAPHTIECLETGRPYTDKGAWGLICHLLERCPDSFQKVILDKPPGQVAYQMKHTLRNGTRVFIKVQLSHGKARARSFHISDME